MVLTRILATAVAAVALTACTSTPEPVTDEVLLADLRSAGVQPAKSVASWRVSMTKAVCESPEQALELTLTMRDVAREQMQSMRVAAVHFCPERVPLIDAALSSR